MADTVLEENKNSSSTEKTELDNEATDVSEGSLATKELNSSPKETMEHVTNDSTICDNDDKEALNKFELMFKDRFTDLDPGYLPYKNSNDAEAIPIVDNFPPPWNPQNRRDAYRGRGHGSHHQHQQNRYKRRHDEYRSHDNRRDNYHSNYQDDRQHRQDQYYGHRSNYESRDQGYRRY